MTEEELRKSYDDLLENPLKVYEIFKEYFGEDKTDFQYLSFEDYKLRYEEESEFRPQDWLKSCDILIWFPEVKVTNENDKSIIIRDLYVKVSVCTDGTLMRKPTMNRATFSYEEWVSGYSHSHLPNIYEDELKDFRTPCFGSGPINDTIEFLLTNCDEEYWMLLCSEIEDFVQVESIEGRPFKYLEKVGDVDNTPLELDRQFLYIGRYSKIHSSEERILRWMSMDFLRYVIQTSEIPLEYTNNVYTFGMSYMNSIIWFSNKFIEWYNRDDNPYRKAVDLESLLCKNYLMEGKIKEDGKFYTIKLVGINSPGYPEDYNGTELFSFKEKAVLLSIDPPKSLADVENTTILLSPSIVSNFESAILKTINFKYGRKTNSTKDALSGKHAYYI